MIDFSARETHFVDHLAPIWHALPVDARGTFWAAETAAGRCRALGIEPAVGEPPDAPQPVVVASWGDLRLVRRHRRPIVLFEHGAGQSYSSRHPSYAGGKGRENVCLFVVPNARAATRNRRFYPAIPNVVVGSARVDQLRTVQRHPGPPTAAITWHWRCQLRPETDTALDHYRDHLAEVAETLSRHGITLVGHAHPRIADELAPIYTAARIEMVRSFDEIVGRADVLACDNSSVMFEWAALDRPVVVVNSPRYRRRTHHGLRFWDCAGIGPHVDRPDQLAATILAAFARDLHAIERRRLAGLIYPPLPGGAAAAAARAIVDHALAKVAV